MGEGVAELGMEGWVGGSLASVSPRLSLSFPVPPKN